MAEGVAKRGTARRRSAKSDGRHAKDGGGKEAQDGGERLPDFGDTAVLAAALAEIGAPKDEFGLMLKVGSLVPKAQAGASEFAVTGLGLAELSDGLSRWLKQAGKTDIPLQVIDDGSGKIKVLIS